MKFTCFCIELKKRWLHGCKNTTFKRKNRNFCRNFYNIGLFQSDRPLSIDW